MRLSPQLRAAVIVGATIATSVIAAAWLSLTPPPVADASEKLRFSAPAFTPTPTLAGLPRSVIHALVTAQTMIDRISTLETRVAFLESRNALANDGLVARQMLTEQRLASLETSLVLFASDPTPTPAHTPTRRITSPLNSPLATPIVVDAQRPNGTPVPLPGATVIPDLTSDPSMFHRYGQP